MKKLIIIISVLIITVSVTFSQVDYQTDNVKITKIKNEHLPPIDPS